MSILTKTRGYSKEDLKQAKLTRPGRRLAKNYNQTKLNNLDKTRERKQARPQATNNTKNKPNKNPAWKQDSRQDQPNKYTRIIDQSKIHQEKGEPLENAYWKQAAWQRSKTGPGQLEADMAPKKNWKIQKQNLQKIMAGKEGEKQKKRNSRAWLLQNPQAQARRGRANWPQGAAPI